MVAVQRAKGSREAARLVVSKVSEVSKSLVRVCSILVGEFPSETKGS